MKFFDVFEDNTAKAACRMTYSLIKNEGGPTTIKHRRSFNQEPRRLSLEVVGVMTPSKPCEKSKFWRSAGSMVGRLKREIIHGTAPPVVELEAKYDSRRDKLSRFKHCTGFQIDRSLWYGSAWLFFCERFVFVRQSLVQVSLPCFTTMSEK